MTKKVTLTVRISNEYKEKLRLVSKVMGISMSHFIEGIIAGIYMPPKDEEKA